MCRRIRNCVIFNKLKNIITVVFDGLKWMLTNRYPLKEAHTRQQHVFCNRTGTAATSLSEIIRSIVRPQERFNCGSFFDYIQLQFISNVDLEKWNRSMKDKSNISSGLVFFLSSVFRRSLSKVACRTLVHWSMQNNRSRVRSWLFSSN